MLGALFYTLWLVLSALVVLTVLTLYIGFWVLAVLTGVMFELVRSFIQWRRPRPKPPPFHPPVPQARFSDRR